MSDAVVASSAAAIGQGSKSFAAAARLFDRRTREDAVMLYAWCRHCDDVIDGQELGWSRGGDFRAGQRARLEALKAQTASVLAGGAEADPAFAALARVVARNAIPKRYPEELLRGFEMDVEERSYDATGVLLDYCYHVAGVVGVMMAMIMGAREPGVLDRASDLGLAFQLTNIARDVIEDARAGRVYLPREILDRHGIGAVDPEDSALRPRLHAAALELLDLADRYHASAAMGLAALPPRSAWAVAAAGRVYGGIGTGLRRLGPRAWDARVSTSGAAKLGLILRGLGDVARSRLPREAAPRAGLYSRP